MNNNRSSLEPWLIGLQDRIKIFCDTKRNGKKIALYYAKVPDGSTFRYRCYNTFDATLQSKKWQAVYFFDSEMKEFEKYIDEADLLIFGRCRWGNNIKRVLDEGKKQKIPVLFDIDDLVFDDKYIQVVLNTISGMSTLDYWMPYFADIQKTAKQCDGFLTTNVFLGDKLKESFKKPYKVIRNSLNSEQVEASIVYSEIAKNKKNNKFIVGYFGGSPTHKNDLDVALPEILEFLKKHKDAILRVVGYMTFDERANKFLENGQIEFVPPVDFRKLQRLMAEVDVNIAPLVINDFTNCKSELKFFEAAAVDTTTIASPTYTFKKAIVDGENGFLAQQGEWYDKLEFLYKHPEENRKIAKAAKKYALEHYYGKEFLKEVEAAYDYFAK